MRNEGNIMTFFWLCTISMACQRKEASRSMLLHTKGLLYHGYFLKCLACKIPSFPWQSSPLIVVLSAVVTSIISWLSETGVHFQRRIWKMVSFFSFIWLECCWSSWVSHSDFIQRFSYNICTECESAARICLNKLSLMTVLGNCLTIYCNFVKSALTLICCL